MHDHRTFDADLVGMDDRKDIAVLKLEEAPADLRVVSEKGKPVLPLTARDREVQLALDTLKSHETFPGRVATSAGLTSVH